MQQESFGSYRLVISTQSTLISVDI